MKQLIGFVFSLALGSAVGGVIGYKMAKKKYENLADVEVASVKKVFEERYANETKQKNNKPKATIDIPKIKEVEDAEVSQKYVDYSKRYRTDETSSEERIVGKPTKKTVKNPPNPRVPYMINPEEFKESHYEVKTLFYFSDKVVTDEDYKIIKHPEDYIGTEALGQFGIYEDDAVYIRDDSLGVDYEILLDERAYAKVNSSIKPKTRVLSGEDPEDL